MPFYFTLLVTLILVSLVDFLVITEGIIFLKILSFDVKVVSFQNNINLKI